MVSGGVAVRWWLLTMIALCGCGRIGFDVTVEDPTADGETMGVGGGSSNARIELVQSANGWSTSRVTSRSVSLSAAPKTGDLVIVAVSTSFTAPVSVTDTAGNTYQGVLSNPTANSSTYCNIMIYYARNIVSVDGFTATVMTSPGDDYLSVVVLEVAGADPLAPLAADARNAGTGASPMVGPIQSTRDDAFYFALLCHNATRTTSMGSAYQLLEVPTEAGSSNSAMVTAYRFAAAVPTIADATLSGSDSWQMMLAAFD